MNLISLLITILIIALVFALVWWILGQMPIPEPFRMVVNAILGLIAIILLLSIVFGGVSVPTLRLGG
jgi:cytochrome c biogenesis factor